MEEHGSKQLLSKGMRIENAWEEGGRSGMATHG